MAARSKAPAFQFYPQDFIMGCAMMSAEEVGGYIRLLCYQWEHGSIPDDDTMLCRLSGCGGNAVASIRHKFGICEYGKLKNARLEQVRAEQDAYRNRQAENAAKRWQSTPKVCGGNATAMPSQCGGNAVGVPAHMPEGMPNACPTSTPTPTSTTYTTNADMAQPAPVRPRFSKPSIDQVRDFCKEIGKRIDVERFYNHYESNGWKVGRNPMKDWKAAVRKWAGNENQFARGGQRKAADNDLSLLPPDCQAALRAAGEMD